MSSESLGNQSVNVRRVGPIEDLVGSKPALYSRTSSSVVPLLLETPDQKKLRPKIEEIWDKAKLLLKQVDPKATDLRIDLSHPTVLVTYTRGVSSGGGVGVLHASQTADLQDLVSEIRDLSKQVWGEFYFHPMVGNRFSLGKSHLQIISKKWEKHHPRSLKQYLDPKAPIGLNRLGEHFQASLSHVVAAEALILNLKAAIEKKIKEQTESLEQLPPREAFKKKETLQHEMQEWNSLLALFDSIDRFAFYSVIAFWGDEDPESKTEGDLIAGVNELSNAVAQGLRNGLEVGADTRSRAEKGLGWFTNDPEGKLQKQLEPHIVQYARETGDCSIQDPHLQAALTIQENREVKNASIEQFLVSVALGSPERAKLLEKMNDLGKAFSEQTQNGLVQILERGITFMKAELEKIKAASKARDWKENQKILEKDPRFQYLFKAPQKNNF